jgi:hypothetical protein
MDEGARQPSHLGAGATVPANFDIAVGDKLSWLLSPAAIALYLDVVDQPRPITASVRDAADELIRVGLVRPTYSNDAMFAFPPKAALMRALHKATGQWLGCAPDFDGTLAAIDLLESLPSTATGTQVTRSDSGRAQQELESLVVSASVSVCVLQPYPDHIPPENLLQANEWSSSPDINTLTTIKYRYVYEDRVLAIPGIRDLVAEELGLGAEVRLTTDRLPTFMVIVDHKSVAYFPDPLGPGHIATESGHVGLLRLAFDAAWNKAIPIQGGTKIDLTATQHRVLALVALGHNNRSIGSMLGLHERTVRRRIDELLEFYGETSRPGLVRHATDNLDGID